MTPCSPGLEVERRAQAVGIPDFHPAVADDGCPGQLRSHAQKRQGGPSSRRARGTSAYVSLRDVDLTALRKSYSSASMTRSFASAAEGTSPLRLVRQCR